MKFFEPNISDLEISRVVQAMNESHLSDGHITGEFEDVFKEKFGYEYVVAMNSGTSVMYSVLLAAGIGPGDEVIVCPYTFIASVHVAMLVGATIVFADIDRGTYNLSIDSVMSKVTEKTKAVIPVDVFGVPFDSEGLKSRLPPHILVLEDSIEALGSTRRGEYLGKDVDAAVFGFSPNKQITTCEGGILVTKNKYLHDEVRRIRQHGSKTGDPHYMRSGHNFRMTDIHAAIGVAQLHRFPEIQEGVKKAEEKLDVYFKSYRKQVTRPEDYGTMFVYVIELPEGVNKDKFIVDMAKEGIPIKPYFRNLAEYPHLRGFGDCPVAKEVGSRTVALPTPFNLLEEQAQEVYEAFIRCVS